MVPGPSLNWTRVNNIVIIAEEMDTQKTLVLNCISIHRGGVRKGGHEQGESRDQVKDMLVMLHLYRRNL
jgi:hypothetical protein